ncbi:hypothetical protein FACS1894205_3490 [Alphaproteobacteria bacterium]|nr:hypothetical protein FACS1894205_3490 [Alphaproteobacteria bacterium]
MSVAEGQADVLSLSFEQALAELERIVRQLEEGKGELDGAIAAYERGVQLKRCCERRLVEAEARIDQIMTGADGTIAVRPADIGQAP